MKMLPRNEPDRQPPCNEAHSSSRRKFLEKMRMATVAAGVLGKTPVGFAQSGERSGSSIPDDAVSTALSGRVQQALDLRVAIAQKESRIPVPLHTTNGDEQRYPDRSASYSKGLLQNDIGVVNPAAWASLKRALRSGRNSDFEAVIIGGKRTLNGPQDHMPSIWKLRTPNSSAMRRATNPTAVAAAAELTSMPAYKGPRDTNGNVTPGLLFRGRLAGDTAGRTCRSS